MGADGEKVIQGKQDYMARLVVQGCQEGKGYIRTDTPTGSRDAFFMTLAAVAQDGWDYNVFDARSAYLQPDGIERLLLLRMPHKSPSLGRNQGKCLLQLVRTTGREMLHSKKVLEAVGFVMDLMDLRLSRTHMSMTS